MKSRDGDISFSFHVKEELGGIIPGARHCQLAEICAFLLFAGELSEMPDGHTALLMETENRGAAEKYLVLLERAFQIKGERQDPSGGGRGGRVTVSDTASIRRILAACRMTVNADCPAGELPLPGEMLIRNFCCRRSFLRGAFLCSGSLSNPRKSYHFEIVCRDPAEAEMVREAAASFSIDAKTVVRKRYHVVYIKEGNDLAEILRVMGAELSVLELENIRVVKEVANQVNREVNCEAANMKKTANAAVLQIRDILYIRDTVGLDILSPPLKEAAEARLLDPEATLPELASRMSGRVGKSGINHRLKKIMAIASEIREDRGE